MSNRGRGRPAATLGFTVKSGWTCAVLLAGDPSEPRAVDARRVAISDPAVPESCQPYHEGFGTARGAGETLKALLRSVERFGAQSVATFIQRHQKAYDVRGAGLVVGSLIDPDTIANDHIRIHALEGQLFRNVIRKAAVRCHVDCAVWRERDLYGAAATTLRAKEAALKTRVSALGREIDGPWRAEHKAAAMAAWMVLTNPQITQMTQIN